MKRNVVSCCVSFLAGLGVGVLILSAVYSSHGLTVRPSVTSPPQSVGTMVQTQIYTATNTPVPAVAYIGNRNSGVFHKPTCASVSQMYDSNKIYLYSRDQAIEQGYRPCGRCHP